jgi:hypothetical protein
MLFDYEFSFIKRGLFGHLMGYFVSPPYPYLLLAIVAYAVFAVWLVLLLILLYPLIRAQTAFAFIACLFFVSPGFVYMVHTIGYFDHVGLAVVLICLFLPANGFGIGARVLMSGLALLVHEAFFVLYFPVLVYDLLLKLRIWTHQRGATAIVALVIITAGLGTRYLANTQLSSVSLAEYRPYLAAKAANFELRGDAVETLGNDSAHNLGVMRGMWSDPFRWISLFIDLLLILPLALFFVALTLIRLTNEGGRRSIKIVAAVAAASPLMLHVVAWDLFRFDAAVQLSAFLILLSTVRPGGLPRMEAGRERRFQRVGIGLIVLTLSTEVGLFDGYVAQRLPFRGHLNHIRNVLQGDASLIVVPAD